nr:lipid phosphate phosphatase 2-like isoform X1 [Lolium perenne]
MEMQASSVAAGTSTPACAFATIRSHGVRVARSHAYDWLVLLLLVAVEVLLNVIEPFHRFVGASMMTDLSYPMKSNTVPVWAVPIIAVIAPMIIFTVVYFQRRNVYDLHHAILGILFSVLITGVLTDAIKDAVGRPRPDFFWRCFPDGIAVYDNVTTGVICNGIASVIKEGQKSFPSGHTSWSFAGLGFLSWYLAGKITIFDRRGHVAKLCIVILPLLVAVMVAVSRVDDYWHHWTDVCTGGILGTVVASVCYLQFFPPPSDEKGFWPHAHFRHITESQDANRTQCATEMSNTDSRPLTDSTTIVVWQDQTRTNTSRTLDAMESGTLHAPSNV